MHRGSQRFGCKAEPEEKGSDVSAPDLHPITHEHSKCPLRNPSLALASTPPLIHSSAFTVKVGRGSGEGEVNDSPTCTCHLGLLRTPCGHWRNSQDQSSSLLELSGSLALSHQSSKVGV